MPRALRIATIFKNQGFTLALLAAVVAAVLFPELGAKGGPLKTELTTKIAVALTFVVQGLSLPTRHIARSAAKLRLHAFCQIANFVVAPLLMLGFLAIFGSFLHPGIRIGFLYLSALPTTISSAIVMTANSDGDSSAALFATALSNILGIFVTPLLCALLIESPSSGGPSLANLIGKLSTLVLLPLVVGQCIRPFVRGWAIRSKKLFKRLSNSFIVFVVFAAFCSSVQNGIWVETGAAAVGLTFGFVLLFLLCFSGLVWMASRLATGERPERIAAFFCGSQKTLASGVPMAPILFAHYQGQDAMMLGLVILPLMCYHPLQLILAGILSPFLAKGKA